MTTIRKALLGMAVGVGLTMGMQASTANAQMCFWVFDAVRTGLFGTQATSRMTAVYAEAAKTSSKKEELKLWEQRRKFKDKDDEDKDDSEESSEEGDEGGSGKMFPEGIYYDYMKNANATGSEEYLPSKSDAKEQAKYVRENFFYDSDVSKVTEDDKKKVQQKRQAYVEALATEVLSLSAGARENIASELGILKKAKTTAGGIIQQVDLLAQTKKVMVEQKAADILMQAKLLELESAQLLLNLDPQRTEKPDESDNGITSLSVSSSENGSSDETEGGDDDE